MNVGYVPNEYKDEFWIGECRMHLGMNLGYVNDIQ